MPPHPDPSPALPRRILLVDADAFFVAVARLVDPDGAGRAPLLIVGGSAASRGVVCSASYETRRFGVRSAMPIAQALRLCPHAMCVPVPRRACSEKSREIRRLLQAFTPVVESASIDEWYLDLTGTDALYGGEPLSATASRIRDVVHGATGLAVSIGGGINKLVAKLAAEVAKPRPGSDGSGVHIVTPDAEGEFLRRFTLAELPLVGPSFQARLARLGLTTVDHVLAHDEAALCEWFGARTGRWLYRRVRGIDGGAVHARDVPKGISREDTFGEDIGDDRVLARELQRLVVRAAADLRSSALAARTITVKLRDFDFETRRASRTLAQPVTSDRVIHSVARDLLRRLRSARRCRARLVGVSLAALAPSHVTSQLGLFEPARGDGLENERDRALSQAVDELRARFGGTAIVPGTMIE